jgi:hypothetical protein
MDIEKELFPNANKVIKKKGVKHLLIIDEELDHINCIVEEGCINFDTSKLKYIKLGLNNIEMLYDILIDEQEKLYKKLNKNRNK